MRVMKCLFDLSKVSLGRVYRHGKDDLLVISVKTISDFEFRTVVQHRVCVGSSKHTLKDSVISEFIVITKNGKVYHLQNVFDWSPIPNDPNELWQANYEYTETDGKHFLGHELNKYWWDEIKDDLPMTKEEFLSFFDTETAKEISSEISS